MRWRLESGTLMTDTSLLRFVGADVACLELAPCIMVTLTDGTQRRLGITLRRHKTLCQSLHIPRKPRQHEDIGQTACGIGVCYDGRLYCV